MRQTVLSSKLSFSIQIEKPFLSGYQFVSFSACLSKWQIGLLTANAITGVCQGQNEIH